MPDTVTQLELYSPLYEELGLESLPRHLTHLTFGRSSEYNSSIMPGVLPPTLLSIDFGHHFNQPITPGTLPDSLTHVTFGHRFNQLIGPENIPRSLTHIRLGMEFRRVIGPDTFPQTLTHLWMTVEYVHQLPDLPESLTCVYPCTGYSSRIQPNTPLSSLSIRSSTYNLFSIGIATLPQSLTRLATGHLYNHPIVPGSLPPHLTHLTFGENFNHPLIQGQLPESLISLALGKNYSHPLVLGSIPSSVTHLIIDNSFRHLWKRDYIPSVTHITINVTYNAGPRSNRPLGELVELSDQIKTLVTIQGITVRCQDPIYGSHLIFRMLGSRSILITTSFFIFICPLNTLDHFINRHITAGTFHHGMTHITFGVQFNQRIDQENLPGSLTHLKLGARFNMPFEEVTLPRRLTHLWIDCMPIPLPSNIVHLQLMSTSTPYGFNYSETLESISFANSVTTYADIMNLPSSIHRLDTGDLFNQAIKPKTLPPQLTHLTLGALFNQSILSDHLPLSLTHLNLGNDYSKPF
eukprot:gene12368-14509_t